MAETEPQAEPGDAQGERLLRAVESILASNAALTGIAGELRRQASAGGQGEESVRRLAAAAAIARYSNFAALSGGASALPALVPGLGTAVAVAGGALADVTLLLKWELELALVLATLHGRDIADPVERTVAFVLAAAGTADARSGGNSLQDLTVTGGLALWNYAPRHLGKLLVTLLGRLALASASKSLLRAVPLVGVAVGAGANKVLTTRVGERLDAAFGERRVLQPVNDGEVVRARVRGDDEGKA